MIQHGCRSIWRALARTLELPHGVVKPQIEAVNTATTRSFSSDNRRSPITDTVSRNGRTWSFHWDTFGPQMSVGFLREFHSSQVRYRKPKRKQAFDDDEEGTAEDIDEDEVMKGDKLLKVRLSSDRIDAVLKVGLNMSRNKIDKALYADLIRVNGERPTKKNHLINEGDEIDFVVRYSPSNEAFLEVHRLKILHLGSYSRLEGEDSDDEAKMPAKILRTRSLLVENYKKHPIKGNIEMN